MVSMIMYSGTVYGEQQLSENLEPNAIDQDNPLYSVGSVCSSCHGLDGASKDMLDIPILAGQYPAYLEDQLKKFEKGDKGPRSNALMSPIAQALSPEAMHVISQYYGALTKPSQTTPQRDDLAQGKRIYLGGVFDKKIAACSSCHSPTGFGNEPANYPSLAGQHAEYLINQLKNYRSKERFNPMMNSIAENLTGVRF